ncbi:MAG: S8 family serine peptidase [Acidobacteria bacterium]|nr:S8 family serine peptidase [Acidobacteriota bacterium]
MDEELKQFSPFFNHPGAAIVPTPLRLRSEPAYTGRGVTIAFLDSGFYPPPDLVTPANRIKGYHNVLRPAAGADALRRELEEVSVDSWHGMMTSVVAAGNGALSDGAYRGIASEAELVLVKVGSQSRIEHDRIREGIEWVIAHREKFDIRILNISCGGDENVSYLTDGLSRAAEDAVRAGLVVVAAAGNRGWEPDHPVVPPANCPAVITVGGLDDENRLDWSGRQMYRSSYGPTIDGLQKPEVIAPAIWLAGPILPGTSVADQARLLMALDRAGDRQLPMLLERGKGADPNLDQMMDSPPEEIRAAVQMLIAEHKVISADYKHVDGTSFAAPITSSIVAQMIEANPALTPSEVKRGLLLTAQRLRRVPVDQQGWGVVNPTGAVQWVLRGKSES